MITQNDAQTLRNLIALLEAEVRYASTIVDGIPLAEAQATLTRAKLNKSIVDITENPNKVKR